MKSRSSYKLSFLDREGPDGALRMRAAGQAAFSAALSLPMWGVVGSQRLGLSGFALTAFTLVSTVTLGFFAFKFALKLGTTAGKGAEMVYMGNDTTPYEDQFSQEQALVMQRDYAGALAIYEAKIAERPGEPRVRIAAADLYATLGANPKRAAELYREVQRIPKIMSGHDIYVSNKLADLYLGALEEPKRALVEFRRLAEKYPGTTAAKHAKMAIANLKEDMIKDHMSS
jgi:hypothetical protein